MTQPYYVDLDQARAVLADIGVHLNERQIKRAAEPNANGLRKLPFFKDPIDGRLKIDKHSLLEAYIKRQVEAENNMRLDI